MIHSKAKKWGVRKGDQRRANVPERKDEIGIELHPVCISISRLIVTDKETGCRGEGPEALDRDRLIGLAGTGLESRWLTESAGVKGRDKKDIKTRNNFDN